MFDYQLKAEVKSIETLIPKVDGPVAKVCRIKFRREIDVSIARALGGDFGAQALKGLHDRAITKIVFPIDAVTAKAVLNGSGGTSLEIAMVTGMKAVAKAKKTKPDKDPEPPMVELQFQFPFSKEAWLFFGENHSATVDLLLSQRQLALPLAKPAAEAKPNGKKTRAKKGAAGNKSSHGNDHAEAAGEISDSDDPEAAAQKEREESMADERAWQ